MISIHDISRLTDIPFAEIQSKAEEVGFPINSWDRVFDDHAIALLDYYREQGGLLPVADLAKVLDESQSALLRRAKSLGIKIHRLTIGYVSRNGNLTFPRRWYVEKSAALALKSVSLAEVAERLKLSEGAVRDRAKAMGIKLPFSGEDVEKLASYYAPRNDGRVMVKELAEKLGVTPRTVRNRAKANGIPIVSLPTKTCGGVQRVAHISAWEFENQ